MTPRMVWMETKLRTNARSIKVEFDQSDIRFWFSQLEDEMAMASIKSQWLKRSVLQRNLPTKQKVENCFVKFHHSRDLLFRNLYDSK